MWLSLIDSYRYRPMRWYKGTPRPRSRRRILRDAQPRQGFCGCRVISRLCLRPYQWRSAAARRGSGRERLQVIEGAAPRLSVKSVLPLAQTALWFSRTHSPSLDAPNDLHTGSALWNTDPGFVNDGALARNHPRLRHLGFRNQHGGDIPPLPMSSARPSVPGIRKGHGNLGWGGMLRVRALGLRGFRDCARNDGCHPARVIPRAKSAGSTEWLWIPRLRAE